MNILTNLYYISTLFFMWYELQWILNTKEKCEENKKFFKLYEQFKGKKWNEFSDLYKTKLKEVFKNVYVLAWIFIGVFTVQWVAFVIFIIYMFVIISPISKNLRTNEKSGCPTSK